LVTIQSLISGLTTEITFENNAAKKIYSQVLNKTESNEDADKVRKAFRQHARLDGDNSLSLREARILQSAFKHYDQTMRSRLGIYEKHEVNRVLAEVNAAKKAKGLYNLAFDYDHVSKMLYINKGSLAQLKELIKTTAEKGYLHSTLIDITRRLKLTREDHILILQHEHAKNPYVKKRVLGKIIGRIKWLMTTILSNYDGIISPYKSYTNKQLDALLFSLETINLKKSGLEPALARINLEVIVPYANALDDPSFLSPYKIDLRNIIILSHVSQHRPLILLKSVSKFY